MKTLIRTGSDPVLKEVCRPVSPSERLEGLFDLMERACKKAGNGVGLAAPQVGDTRRVIYTFTTHRGTLRGRFFVNPVITSSSINTHPAGAPPSENPDFRNCFGHGFTIGTEGCLSYPGIFKRIKRAASIALVYQDRFGIEREETVTGFEGPDHPARNGSPRRRLPDR